MTPRDEERLIEELAALDEMYAYEDDMTREAEERWAREHPGEDPPEDPMDLLRRAALNRGQP